MRRALLAAVAASLLTGAVIAATGVAVTDDDDSGPPPTMAQALEDREAKRDQRLAAVAKRLGVSANDLEKAVEKARAAQLDQAVSDGRLTGAQRDAIVACKAQPLTCDRSNLPAHGPRHGERARNAPTAAQRRQMRSRMRAERTAFFAAVAKELGKDAADVRRAFQAERPAMGRRGGRGGHHGPGGHGPGGPEGFGGPGGPGF